MIRELHQKGWSLTAIPQETGFDRKTIRKYINAEQLPRSSQRTKRGSKLDPYKLFLASEKCSEWQLKMSLANAPFSSCSILHTHSPVEIVDLGDLEKNVNLAAEFVYHTEELKGKNFLDT